MNWITASVMFLIAVMVSVGSATQLENCEQPNARQLQTLSNGITTSLQEVYTRIKIAINNTLNSLKAVRLDRADMDAMLRRLMHLLGIDPNRASRVAENAINWLVDWINSTFLKHRSILGRSLQNGIPQLQEWQQLPRAVWAWLADGQLQQPLEQLVTAASNRQLPRQLIKTLMDMDSQNTLCLQLALCTGAPLVWSAQSTVNYAVHENQDKSGESLLNVARNTLPSFETYKQYTRQCFEEFPGCLPKLERGEHSTRNSNDVTAYVNEEKH